MLRYPEPPPHSAVIAQPCDLPLQKVWQSIKYDPPPIFTVVLPGRHETPIGEVSRSEENYSVEAM
eukprot:182955-Amphidinium_carterae.1